MNKIRNHWFNNQKLNIFLKNFFISAIVFFVSVFLVFIIKFILFNFFLNVSLKNYIIYFIWNILYNTDNFFNFKLFPKNLISNISQMILLNNWSNGYITMLYWNLQYFVDLNNSNIYLHNVNQLEVVTLQNINLFILRLEEFLSFLMIFLSIFFLKISLKNSLGGTLVNNHIIAFSRKFTLNNYRQHNLCAHILINFFFLLFFPIFIAICLWNFVQNLCMYLFRKFQKQQNLSKIYKIPKLVWIIWPLNLKYFNKHELNKIRTDSEFRIKIEVNYLFKIILINIISFLKNLIFFKNQILVNRYEKTSMKLFFQKNKILINTYVLIKILFFYSLKILQHTYVFIYITSRAKLSKFYFYNYGVIFVLYNIRSFLKKFFFLWRPLFKRWSYLGLFFKSRVSWIRFANINEL